MDYIALGKRIRQQRKILNMTQSELAKAVDVSTAYIGHIERGIKHCSLDTIVDLANTLRIAPDILLQDSLNPELFSNYEDMSLTNRSILNGIANVLREHDVLPNELLK